MSCFLLLVGEKPFGSTYDRTVTCAWRGAPYVLIAWWRPKTWHLPASLEVGYARSVDRENVVAIAYTGII